MTGTIRDRLIRCFAAVFDEVDEAGIPALSVESEPTWDSLAFVMLASVVQQEFSVEIPLEEVAELNTFQKFLAKVESHGSVY